MSGCRLLAMPEWPRDEHGFPMDALSACEAIGGCGRDACAFFEEAGGPWRGDGDGEESGSPGCRDL